MPSRRLWQRKGKHTSNGRELLRQLLTTAKNFKVQLGKKEELFLSLSLNALNSTLREGVHFRR